MRHVRDRQVTIKDLQERGLPITRGNAYIPKRWLPKRPIPLKDVHKRLAKIQGSLADDVAQMRDEG